MEEMLSATLFSVDIVNFVLKDERNHCPISMDAIPREYLGQSPFTSDIGMAVLAILEDNIDTIQRKFKELEDVCAPPCRIAEWALTCSLPYFEHGYKPVAFLFYCGLICGMADMFYSSKLSAAAVSFPGIISSVLTAFILTREFSDSGGWNALGRAAKMIVRNENKMKL